MNIRLRVNWANPQHPLLQNPQVEVVLDGKPQSNNKQGAEFLIADSVSEVKLFVSFFPTIASFKSGVLVAIGQTYKNTSGTLQPVDATIGDAATKQTTVVRHPLIVTDGPKQATKAGEVLWIATILVDFVDVTSMWRNFAGKNANCKESGKSCVGAYDDLHEAGTELVALGLTSGTPLIWFASIPKACTTTDSISGLVFYRPANYIYSTMDDSQHATSGQFALNRYLLRPRKQPAFWWNNDRYANITTAQHDTVPTASFSYDWLCAGFENALDRSGKPVVLLQPWPSGIDFGTAKTASLPELVAAAIRILWVLGKLSLGVTNATVKRLGISGYSAGGPGMWAAFDATKNNNDKPGQIRVVREIYLFDANDTAAHSVDVVQWACHTNDARLRMVAGYRQNEHEKIANSIAKACGAGNISFHPPSAQFWDATSSTGGKWWKHVFQNFAPLPDGTETTGYNFNTRHQFILYGGEDAGFTAPVNPGDKMDSVTFLEQFLKASSF